MRIGHGFDAHRFCDGDHVMMGGIRIPHTHGIEAHSDGDVLLHALCDALLGAAGLGDIGHFYPPTDVQFKGMDSRIFLRDVYAKVKAKGYTLGNADITIVAQAPKMSPHRDAMRASVAEDLGVPIDLINIKATTTEGMGYIGRNEGMVVYAVVLIVGAKHLSPSWEK
ncbi:MAG: 2-C-methyl-D-erythritol 2,4-cyclodiphosphate synthase [Gammaproteobacteria bacterium]